MKLYCATTNQGKLREFRLAIEALSAGAWSAEPVEGFKDIPAYEETGATFEENASGKAVYYSMHAPGLLFADDSGLMVDALSGAPGVHSARYAGPHANDKTNNRLLLERLAGVADRTARFVCVAALAERGKLLKTFRGVVEGRILDAPRGSDGFGYDPLFYYPPFNCTFAEIPGERKQQVSHRGQALEAMVEYLLSRGRDASRD
ncbi:MAG: RdgB/HAM1 family non-canonical purine NTP pyrophosphatase [Acidobacteriales bacterium]|nr:RdgB/HAM1 family non-canonical purine NTP pyrophosphatase [Terriglobales bacterium]